MPRCRRRRRIAGRCSRRAPGPRSGVKHENHTPIGAFKIRGGLVYMDRLRREDPAAEGAIAATRGNFGQSIAVARG